MHKDALVGDSEMEIDHHDPTLKGEARHRYENLFPAIAPCNSIKHENWPSIEEQRNGIRFLNPCKETDYDHQIFEDPGSHELVGTTPAAIYHIEMLGLNSDALIRRRKDRTAWLRINSAVNPDHLDKRAIALQGFNFTEANKAELSFCIDHLKRQIEIAIPPIKPPPVSA